MKEKQKNKELVEKWILLANQQLQLLQMIENKIKMEELEGEFYEELIQIQFSVNYFKKITEDK